VVEDQSAGDGKIRTDPTILTTRQLVREIASLKELIFTRLDGMDKAISLFNENITRVPTDTDKQIQHLKELHEVRFEESHSEIESVRQVEDARIDGMDKAIILLQNIADKLPARIDEKIVALRSVHEEKFSSIQTQFRERDVRTEQSSKDSKVAVDAALQAAKEAVGEQNKSSALAIAKSEASTTKQIDQMGQLIQSGNKAVDDKFNDVKERVTRIEGMGEGKHATGAFMFSILAALVSMASLIVALVIAFHK
jgi:hypothetical protein